MKTKYSKKTLFNKNHIMLTVTEGIQNDGKYIHLFRNRSGSATSMSYKMERRKKHEERQNVKVIRAKSPLGFYYNKTVIVDNSEKKQDRQSNVCTTMRFDFIMFDKTYTLTYFSEFNGNQISQEVRPYYIADKLSIPDHFITTLFELIESVRYEMKQKPMTDVSDTYFKEIHHTNYYESEYYRADDGNAFKKIYSDLFGDPKGPRFQTNEEKILSHGFDIKTSFRNVK